MILVVDDNSTNLLLMSTLASQACGEKAKTFEDPLAALDWCDANTPDLVFVDYMMPGANGHEFIERFRLKPNCSAVPVVMVTALDEAAVRQKALLLGATEFISKPIDNSEFKLRAKNLLMLRRAMNGLEQRVREATQALEVREAELMAAISQAAEFRDPETGAHTIRVGRYAHLTARALGIADPYLADILKAAPMHDLGKIGIPDAILLKPGKLDEREFAVMRTHPALGAKIAMRSGSPVMKLAAEISLNHHEKFDGSGYPRGLSGENIPISGRLVAIADVFDALTTARPYKEAWPVERAREWMLSQVGTHFCPKCAGAFFAHWDEVLAIMAEFPDGGDPV